MKEEEIARLLTGGTPPAQLVSEGYSRSTTYKVAGRLRKGVAIPRQPGDGESGERPLFVDPALEADPEIVALKKEVRKAELERLLKEIRAPIDLEVEFAGMEQKLKDLEAAVGYALGTLAEEVESSPLSGLWEKFKCECSAKGLVAARVHCTICGRETSYGWSPVESR